MSIDLPSLALAVAVNRRVRTADELGEPDDLDRVANALARVAGINDPVEAAARLMFNITYTQGFWEGNKRTALLLARWILDRNYEAGDRILPPADRDVADLLVSAASGIDVEEDIVKLLRSRR